MIDAAGGEQRNSVAALDRALQTDQKRQSNGVP
jgi:hypothetical protein